MKNGKFLVDSLRVCRTSKNLHMLRLSSLYVQGNISVGSYVCAEDAQLAWIDGQVTKINGENAEIQTSNGKTVVANLSKIYPKDMEAPAGGVDDMTKLSYLNEPGVLQNLAARYELNEIYDLTEDLSRKDRVVSTLVGMDFLVDEASSVIDRCGMLLEIVDVRT